ncbi:MAG: hypothetical protein DI566_04370 [Microbacterium sp.]|nr:MAG: hypothetical protein DI566_04370 [Microbacterium sp.]
MSGSSPKRYPREHSSARNAVAHGYFAIDLGILWSTVRLDIPLLA